MPAPFSPSAHPSHPRPGGASVRTRNAAMIRRGHTMVAAGAPGFAVFVQTLFQVATAWFDVLTLDVPSLDVLSWRLGVAGVAKAGPPASFRRTDGTGA